MFDSTVQDFLAAREKRNGVLDHNCGIPRNKMITDATSYDILRQPPYYEPLNYVIPAERRVNRNYEDCDEIRRVLDFPYFEGQEYIDNLFTHREGPKSVRKFCDVGTIPTIRPKAEYR